MAWSQGLEEAARKKQEGHQMEWETGARGPGRDTGTHWVSMICWSCWVAAARKIILSTPASKANTVKQDGHLLHHGHQSLGVGERGGAGQEELEGRQEGDGRPVGHEVSETS